MWIKRSTYVELEKKAASQGATIELLQHILNHERKELALLKGKVLGIPADAPQIEVVTHTPTVRIPPVEESKRPTARDVFAGNIGFEDMGDEEAQRQGVDWDPFTGQPAYR